MGKTNTKNTIKITKINNEDFGSTTSVADVQNLSNEEYQLAKQIAQREHNRYYNGSNSIYFVASNGHDDRNNILWAKRAKELAFISQKNNHFSYAAKCVAASSMAFNCDDEKFINNLINSTPYSFNNICYLANFIEKMKKLSDTLDEMDLEDLKLSGTNLKHINYIRHIMKGIYGVDDYQLIANKLIEIAAKQQDMFMSIYKKKAR